MSANKHVDFTDEELLLAYQEDGAGRWLGILLERYTTLLFGVALKYLKDRYKAEDAVQHIFLKILTGLPKEKITNFRGWIYILMRNHCLNELKNKHFNNEELVGKYFVQDDGEENWFEKSLEEVNNAIESLPEEQRITITLFYLKKYSYDQIIEQTGYTFMQVKSYLQNGKRNLKSIILKKTGGPAK